jgi:hypothetical protein
VKTICQLPLDQIQPGAILGRDVLDAKGNCLLAADVELSANTLALLQRRNIKSVAVVQENNMTVEQQEALQQATEQQLSQRFRQLQDDPSMLQLQALLRDYRLGVS